MANVLGRSIEVPNIENSTAVGAAIHGVVACGLVADFPTGAARIGAKSSTSYHADLQSFSVYSRIFEHYQTLATDPKILAAMECLASLLAPDPARATLPTERAAV